MFLLCECSEYGKKGTSCYVERMMTHQLDQLRLHERLDQRQTAVYEGYGVNDVDTHQSHGVTVLETWEKLISEKIVMYDR